MRTLARALAPSVLCVLSIAAQERPSREARVLDVLRKLPTSHCALASTPLAKTTNAYGCGVIAPAIAGLCGTGWEQAFRPDLARALAAELAAIYGWKVARSASAPHGVAAEIDVFDAERGLGLELRGRAQVVDGWPSVVDEEPARDLSVAEARQLAERGVRVHVADASAFWEAHSGDAFTTGLAYAASVIAFLNEVSEGEDVAIEALLGKRSLRLPWPTPPATRGVAVEAFDGGSLLRVERPCEIALAFVPPRERAKEGLRILYAFGVGGTEAKHEIVLRQRDASGAERELARSASAVLFAPSRFDPARPFALALRLEPGEHRLEQGIWISAAEGAR